MEDALEQIDILPALEPKQRNCLRLLTEEMFGMMETVLEHREATFEIEADKDGLFQLHLITRAAVSEKARSEFLSMSTDGKNLAHKGIKGKMVAMLEAFADGNVDNSAYYAMPMVLEPGDYSHLWQMSTYLAQESADDKAKDWDGMERSIIVNFADDVLIGVRDNKLEMVVKKNF